MILLNGRGQLGTELSKLNKGREGKGDSVYHTWNFREKHNLSIQRECYDKFVRFVDKCHTRIIFISTYSTQSNYYTFFKQLAEGYILTKTFNGIIIRLPTLIGKGICVLMKQKKVEPYGEMELMTVDRAAKEIVNIIDSEPAIPVEAHNRIFRVEGTKIPAKLVYELLTFNA